MKNKSLSLVSKTGALLCMLLITVQFSVAQSVSITPTQTTKETTQKNESTLNNGKIVPRYALTGINDNTTIKGTSTNLMIYNTAYAGVSPNNIYPGYYSNVGTTEKPIWRRIDVTVKNAVKTE